MPIRQPSLLDDKDPNTQAWEGETTDRLNQLEFDFNNTLSVNDIASQTYDGGPTVPVDIVNEDSYANLASRENVIGKQGYFLDAETGRMVVEDIVLRGAIASANFQLTGGTNGIFLDSGTTSFFLNSMHRGDIVSTSVGNLNGGTSYDGIDTTLMSAVPTTTNGYGFDNTTGDGYIKTIYSAKANLDELDVKAKTVFSHTAPCRIIDFISNNAILSTQTGSTTITPTTVTDLQPNGMYSVTIQWSDTSITGADFTSEMATESIVLPPAGISLANSETSAGKGLIELGTVFRQNNRIATIFAEYDSDNTDTPRKIKLARVGYTQGSPAVTIITQSSIGIINITQRMGQ
jgi:hypothetical protein